MNNQEAIKELTNGLEGFAFRDSFIEALSTAVDTLKRYRWIPCAERLPSDYVDVLVTTEGGNIEVFYLVDGKYWDTKGGIPAPICYVLAWMPLPEPYMKP